MEILYVDQWLLIVNKPAGLLSIQDGYDPAIPHIRRIIEPENGRCWIVHRLDKETSGVLVLSRSAEVHRTLNMQFETRKIKKEYRAVVWGIPSQNEIEIAYPLKVNSDRHHRTRVDLENGKKALTGCTKLISKVNKTLLLIRPYTGYTHQIRSHLASIHLPIIGDSLYWSISGASENMEYANYPHLALHAYSIQFEHPITKKDILITCNTPSYFAELIN
jgi:RluA family pseudouridine synthase